MSDPTVRLGRADDGALPYVERLLAANDLPTGDVRSTPGRFYVGYDADDRVGVAGLEVHGSDGLLRSVAVERGARGKGYGAAICDAVEAEAREEGVETLYLLTTTAAEFFADRGYAEIDRTDVPDAVRRTAEFEDLCPVSATCMTKSL